MATITELYKADQQPDANRQGNTVTANEVWYMTTSERIMPVAADLLLYSLGNSNSYSFPAFNNTKNDSNPALRSLGYRAKRRDQGAERAGDRFIVTVFYSTSQSAQATSEDVVDADPIYRSEDVIIDVPQDVNPITGRANTNSTGFELIRPPIQGTQLLKRIIITRNERTYNDIRSQQFINHLNSDTVTINDRSYAPRTLKMEYWNGDPAFDNTGRLYFPTTYKFLVDIDNKHKVTYVDVGTGPDKDGNLPPVGVVGGVAQYPNYLNGEGQYLPKADQYDDSKWFPLEFYPGIIGEKPMNFLRFRGIVGV